MIINLTRNKKGFVSLENLKYGKGNSGNYNVGEYVICKVESN